MARLSPFTKNPRYLQDPAGYPVYLCGYDATADLLRARSPDRAFLQSLARYDVNAVYLNLDAWDRDPADWISPYKRIKGNARTPIGYRRFDLTALNPAFWERVTALIKHASQEGIYVMLGLFSDLGGSPASPGRWERSAWNPANNVNEDALGTGFGDPEPEQRRQTFYFPGISEPSTSQESFVAERQREFVEAALEAGGESPNTAYLLGGIEAAWVRHHAQVLDEATYAPLLLNAALAGHKELEFVAGFVPENPLNDQLPEVGRKTLFAPIAGGEGSGEDHARAARQAAWKIFMQGGQPFAASGDSDSISSPPIMEESGMKTRTVAGDDGAVESVLKAVGGIRQFLRQRRVRFWQMPPGVTPEGLPLLARLGDRYLCYLPHGGTVSLDLSPDAGSYTLAWWNAAEEYLVTAGAVLGGRVREFTAPDDGEWTLDLFKKIR